MADWLDNFVPRPLPDYLDDTVRKNGDRVAIDFLGKTYSFAEMGSLVDRATKGLQDLGVTRGVRVGICLPNCPYFPILYFAVLKAGGTVVNFNPLYVERELAYQASDSETDIMVTIDLKAVYDKVEAVRSAGHFKRIILCPMADILPFPKNFLFRLFKNKDRVFVSADDAHILYDNLVENDGKFEPTTIDPASDIAVLQYTGGTTGTPKGAMLSHRNISANMEQMRQHFPDNGDEQERILCILPFFHVFAMTVAQNLSVLIGAQMILLPRLDIQQMLDTIKRTKPTILPGVPTVYGAINGAPGLDKYDLTSIRRCVSGGAPLPLDVKAEFERKSGCQISEGYGLTEASPIVSTNPYDGLNKAGSIGEPLAGTIIEIRDLEDPDKLMPQGERGEVCVVGPQVMLGYWNRPEETAKVLKDGRLHTGDVGYIDEDGYVFLVDRIKDLILCSGYNVYPRTIEEAAYQHTAVAEAIAIGVPDDYRGEAPKLFVKLVDGASLTVEELDKFLEDYLSVIERPREIEIRDELPKTVVGKLSKKELVEEEEAKRAAAA